MSKAKPRLQTLCHPSPNHCVQIIPITIINAQFKKKTMTLWRSILSPCLNKAELILKRSQLDNGLFFVYYLIDISLSNIHGVSRCFI